MDRLVRTILANGKSLIFICILLVAYAGVVSTQQRQSVFPDVTFPKATFSLDNGFAPLSEMETVFGRPIDSLIGSSVGVVTYDSTIQRGFAKFNVSLDATRNFEADFQLLKGKIATLAQAAPTSSGVPATLTATLSNSNNLALLGYSLVSTSAGYLDLRRVVDTRIVPALQQVQGVGKVEVIGGSLPEVLIKLDPAKLLQYRLTPEGVTTQIRDAQGTRFLGTFTGYGKLILGFNSSGLTDVNAIAALPVRTGSVSLQLSEIAEVRLTASIPGVLTSTDRKPSVLFNVYGAPGVDVMSLSGEVGRVIAQLQTTLPATMKISRWYALADFITTSLGNATKAILIGLAIVSFSVLAFLRSWRAAVPVVVTMVVTLALTLIAMNALGETLNIMTLAGISAAVGLIVDDAIVAVENIARFHELGIQNEAAVERGVTEVMSPLLSSTFTTVAVFAPLGLLTGITGFLFKASALVIVASLMISLVLAVTLAPILAFWLMRPVRRTRKADELSVFKRSYRCVLQTTLRLPLLIVLGAAGTVGVSLFVARSLPTAYLPQWDEGTFIMDMDGPVGANSAEMSRLVGEVESVIASMSVIQTYSRQIGDSALQSNQAHFYMHPKPAGGVGSVFQVMSNLETTLLSRFPNLSIDLHQILPDHFDGMAGKNNVVTIDVFGNSISDLVTAGDAISAGLGKMSGVGEIKFKPPTPVTQFELALDARRLVLHNLTRAEVIGQVRTALDGTPIGFVTVAAQQAALRVVYPDRWQKFSPSLPDMPIFATDGTAVPLSALGTVELRQAPDSVTRKQGHLWQSLTVKTTSADLGGNAARIANELQNLSLPAGAYAIVSGDWKRQVQAFDELRNVFLMAVGMVFTLLLVFFRSYGYAILIVLNTLISLSFVIFGIWLFHATFNVPTFMGLISVMGIVVKNGILVMAFLRDNLRKGESQIEAIIDASLTRARPILMTSAAALLGFLPMALSTQRGGEMMQPFAAAVIYGVIGGVLSSLILLPSMYIVGTRLLPSRRRSTH